MDKVVVSFCSEDDLFSRLVTKQDIKNSPLCLMLDSNNEVIGVTVDNPVFICDEEGEKIEQGSSEDSCSFDQLLNKVGLLPFDTGQDRGNTNV